MKNTKKDNPYLENILRSVDRNLRLLGNHKETDPIGMLEIVVKYGHKKTEEMKMETITIWEVERPEQVPDPDLTKLREICKTYLDMVEKGDGAYADDEQHFIYEYALKALYGDDVFEFINERSG